MQAGDILNEIGKMEESGMEQPWAMAVADTIVKAVEPLATKSDLEAVASDLEAENGALRKELKAESVALRKELKAENENLRKEVQAGFDLLREQARNQALSLKVWVLGSQLALFGGLIATNLLL